MTQLIESVLGGGGEAGERLRAVDWSTTPLGPLEQWPQSLKISVRIMLDSAYPMAISWGRDYTLLYNDALRPLYGTKHPAALGRSAREAFAEGWKYVGPLFDKVMTHRQAFTTPTDQLFPLNRHGYLEECYFAFSYSPIPNDEGDVGGVFATGIDATEGVIVDRRRQLLRDLAARTTEARDEDEVWRLSADTLDEHRLTIPFALLYAYRPIEGQAYRVGPSIEPNALDPLVIDCAEPNPWGFDKALAREGLVVELGQRASVLPRTSWPVPPEKAGVVPIRLRQNSETAGFLVHGIHPGHPFDDGYRRFIHGMAEQMAIGIANARAYERERQRADALAEIDRAKTAFFSNVSHELRTPLQLVLGPIEEILQELGERLGPERYPKLLTAHRNALRLLKLVNTLLDFSRLEAGRVQAVYQPTDLAGLTSDIASMFRSAINSAGLQFSLDCQPIGEPVFVDRDMWEKIVSNLLSNALKFTFAGEVAISLKLVNDAVELQVRDTGVGIPDDQRERVFERFHRFERTAARTHEGTGIGLALVQELVKLHGGSVGVKSAVGVGSTFTLTIPRGKGHLPASPIHTEQSPGSSAIRADAYVEEALRWVQDALSPPVDVPMLAKLPSLGSSRETVPGSQGELIVLADDNADMREYLTRLLGNRYQVRAAADGHQALDLARQLRPALVLADVMMPQLDGFGLLRAIREDSALCGTPVILVSARAGEESRVEGLQANADDYLVKPFTSRELLARVATHIQMANLRRTTAEREERLRNEAELQRQQLVQLEGLKDQLYKENLALKDEVDRASMFEEIVGASAALRAVLAKVAKVAPTDSTGLITGETGTGKELVARAIHKLSRRSGRAFVSVNCAALAPSLIASELFGHEKGAFTGATQRRLGRFELADGGTLFLDEVGELPPDVQVTLLRVLQEREFERIGGDKPIRVDVRVIAATNRDLKAAVANGAFRKDLFYRLDVFPIEVPPLRDRKDDILMLVGYFVQRYAARMGKTIRSVDKKALDLLQSYAWPGNIRELQNIIERSVILTSGEVLSVEETWLSKQTSPPASRSEAPTSFEVDTGRSEREIIESVLAETRGRVSGPSGAAARLRVPASTLETRIKALKINKEKFKFG